MFRKLEGPFDVMEWLLKCKDDSMKVGTTVFVEEAGIPEWFPKLLDDLKFIRDEGPHNSVSYIISQESGKNMHYLNVNICVKYDKHKHT